MITCQRHTQSDKKDYLPFFNVALGDTEGLLAEGDTKRILKGRLSLNRTRQPEYGDQMIFQVYSANPTTSKQRYNTRWNRVEIYIPFNKIDALIKALQELREVS